MSPRVLFVCHTGSVSGAELVLLDVVQPWAGQSALLFEDGPLNQALAARGLNVRISRWGDGLNDVRRNSSFAKVAPVIGAMYGIVAEVARFARKHDVVYANSQKAFVHLHDIISPAHFGKMQRRVQVLLANHCTIKVVVPSKAAADAFVAEGGRRELVAIVPNGLDISPETQTSAELRGELNLPQGPLIGVFSRFAEWKGQHVVLQALAKRPGVSCIIAGSALFGEEAYERRLQQMVQDLDIADRVHFLGQRSDVPRLMRAVDAVIHPSIDPEPFGRTLVEAMLAEVPVIATDAGAASDILEGGKAGMLVLPGDSDALAQAIDKVIPRSSELVEQINYAAIRARSHYGVAQMLDATSRLIRQAAGDQA
jgi:glycosyltransferase involved in cell wall biosynthesis